MVSLVPGPGQSYGRMAPTEFQVVASACACGLQVEAAAEGRAWSLPEDVQRQVLGGLFAQHQADAHQPTAKSPGEDQDVRTPQLLAW